MGFSAFDKRLLDEGLAWFDRPRLAPFLEQLGTTRFERTETLTAMLRNGAPDEVAEAVDLFERVLFRLEQNGAGEHRPSRRRESAAERRARRHGG